MLSSSRGPQPHGKRDYAAAHAGRNRAGTERKRNFHCNWQRSRMNGLGSPQVAPLDPNRPDFHQLTMTVTGVPGPVPDRIRTSWGGLLVVLRRRIFSRQQVVGTVPPVSVAGLCRGGGRHGRVDVLLVHIAGSAGFAHCRFPAKSESDHCPSPHPPRHARMSSVPVTALVAPVPVTNPRQLPLPPHRHPPRSLLPLQQWFRLRLWWGSTRLTPA